MSVGNRDYLSRLQTLLVFSILNGMAKTKLAILSFLCCGEIVKNSIGPTPILNSVYSTGILSENSEISLNFIDKEF